MIKKIGEILLEGLLVLALIVGITLFCALASIFIAAVYIFVFSLPPVGQIAIVFGCALIGIVAIFIGKRG